MTNALLIGALALLSFTGGVLYGAWLFSVPETPSFVDGAANASL